jgi:hypothetical protein
MPQEGEHSAGHTPYEKMLRSKYLLKTYLVESITLSALLWVCI